MINSMDKIDCDHTASYHASLSYENVAAAGLPARPLEFPTPWVHRGSRSTEIALDHRNGKIYSVSNVLMRSEQYPATGVQRCQPDRAYLIKKKIGTSSYGVTRLCVVLRRREVRVSLSDPKPPARQRRESARLKDEDAHWESTDELVVAKVSHEIQLFNLVKAVMTHPPVSIRFQVGLKSDRCGDVTLMMYVPRDLSTQYDLLS